VDALPIKSAQPHADCILSLYLQGLSSPVGAAALAHWDAKLIELVMGAALLVIIVAEQLSKLARWWSTKRLAATNSGRCTADGRGSLLQRVCAEDQQQCWQQQQQKHRCSSAHAGAAASDMVNADAADVSSSSSSSCQYSSSDSSAGSALATATDCVVCVLDADAERMSATAATADASLRTLSSDGQVCGSQSRGLISTSGLRSNNTSLAGPTEEQQNASALLQPLLLSSADADVRDTDLALLQPLLASTAAVADAGLAVSNRDDAGDALQPTGSGSSGGGSVATWAAVLGIGAVAGTASGVMEGLTGETAACRLNVYCVTRC
jgi:hypothetical protein